MRPGTPAAGPTLASVLGAASAPTVTTTSVINDLHGFARAVEHSAAPLGAVLVAAVVIFALYRARNAFRRWSLSPYRPHPAGAMLAARLPMRRPPSYEEGEIPPEASEEPEAGEEAPTASGTVTPAAAPISAAPVKGPRPIYDEGEIPPD